MVHDLIERQEAIDAVRTYYADEYHLIDSIEELIEKLPPAQPETHEERTETHACDLIDRQAAIDEIDEWIKAFLENGHKESAADACLIQDGIIQLPSAQLEIIRCEDCKYACIDPERESDEIYCSENDFWRDDDFYCGFAERRTDEEADIS